MTERRRCVLPARAQLGECPTWSPAEARLYWVDIDGRAVHRFDPATGLDEQRSAPGRPASLALTDTPERLLVAIEGRLAFLDWPSGVWTEWVVLEAADLRNRLNDGRCDPAGRFWVGSMSDPAVASGDGPRPATGLLHRVEADGTAVTVRSGIGVTNGLAFAPDGRTMYFADTHRDTVWAYDYDIVDRRCHQRSGSSSTSRPSRAGPTARASTRMAATGSRVCTAGRSSGSRPGA